MRTLIWVSLGSAVCQSKTWEYGQLVLRDFYGGMNNNKLWWAIIVAVGILGFWVGDWRGYGRSQAEVKKTQEIAGQKAAEDAAKAANPFKAANPLEGVDTNPFEQAKKVLNPFQ